MNKISISSIVKIGVYSAIIILLSLTPIGFITIGPVRLTTIHIPIVIIAILEKPVVSFFSGLIFGLFSLFQHLSGISPMSFMFINPMVSVVPRALIGIGTYYSYQFSNKFFKNIFKYVFPCAIGTFINTFGVLFSAYIFAGKQIYNFLKVNPAKFLFTISITNGLPEIIMCSIIAPLILQKLIKTKNNY